MSRTRRGFTLIELLIVITIILVLAGLLFVFMKRGREAAYATKCMNNIKQIATSQMAIVSDNNGDFVHPDKTKVFGKKRNWSMHFTAAMHPDVDVNNWGKVNDRVVTLEMLNCPMAYSKQKTRMSDHNGHARWRTYGLNTRIGRVEGQYNAGGGDSEGGWVTGASRPDQVEDPSLLILAGETGWNGNAYRGWFGPFNVKDVGMADHHADGFHIAYMDGHVERHTRESFPFPDNRLPDGRLMKWRNKPRTNEERYLSLTWKGTANHRPMPSSPPR